MKSCLPTFTSKWAPLCHMNWAVQLAEARGQRTRHKSALHAVPGLAVLSHSCSLWGLLLLIRELLWINYHLRFSGNIFIICAIGFCPNVKRNTDTMQNSFQSIYAVVDCRFVHSLHIHYTPMKILFH